ncbi:MAG: T9SS type A sorting domain-containing protein [Bacteroidia bacterium]|nr:T9SS type A sorting domain-containing protein [Bacteroidia bacterium]
MNICKWLFFITAFLFTAHLLPAQNPEWKIFANQNIGVSEVHSEGNHLWIATKTGVVDFDKTTHQFEVYDANDGIIEPNSLRIDNQKNKWVGKNYIFQRIDSNGIVSTLLPYNSGFKFPSLNPLGDTLIWMYKYSVAGSKYYEFTPSSFPNPIDSIPYPFGGPTSANLLLDIQNDKWTVSLDTLYYFTGTNWQSVTSKPGLSSARMISTQTGDLFAFQSGSLFQLISNAWSFVWTPPSIGTSLQFVQANPNGELWFKDEINGSGVLYNFNGGSATAYSIPGTLYGTRVDSVNKIWSSSGFSYCFGALNDSLGLKEWEGQQWNYYNISDYPFLQNDLTALVVTAQNEIHIGGSYVSAKSDGVNFYRDSSCFKPNFQIISGLRSYKLDKNNRIWLSGKACGLIDTDPSPIYFWDSDSAKWLLAPQYASLATSNIYNFSTFTLDTAMNIWTASYMGPIAKYDGNTWQYYYFNNMFRMLGIDTRLNQEIWAVSQNLIGTGGQIYQKTPVNPNWIIHDENNTPISVAELQNTKLFMDRLNNVWIKTDQALYKFDGTVWTTYPNSFFGANPPCRVDFHDSEVMYQDNNYDYWIPAKDGLIRWDGATNITFYPLPPNILLQYPNNYNSIVNDIIIDHNNNKWIATALGLYCFNESGIVTSPVAVTSSKIVSGNYYYDTNQNKVRDVTEFGVSAQKVFQTPDSVYLYSDIQGDYHCYTVSGQMHTFTAEPDSIFAITTDSLAYHLWVDTLNLGGNDFGLINLNPTDSMEIAVFPSQFNCFQNGGQIIQYINKGNTVADGRLKFYSDSANFISSTPMPSSNSGDTLIFDFLSLLPFETRTISVIFNYPYPPGTPITFHSSVAQLQGGNYIVRDTHTFTDSTTCSWDPNDKTSFPQGQYQGNVSLIKDELQYLIRFQNTGNDVAYNILITDTLSPDFDLSSFRIIGLSHSTFTELNPQNRVVSFRMNNINLPDSTHNEPESHGYISFAIKAKADIPDSAMITNQAAIYFDFNPPVITNITTNYLVDSLDSGIISHQEASSPKDLPIKVYPNPANEILFIETTPAFKSGIFKLYTQTGQLLLEKEMSPNAVEKINIEQLPGSIYFYQLIENQNQILYGKVVIVK